MELDSLILAATVSNVVAAAIVIIGIVELLVVVLSGQKPLPVGIGRSE